MGAIITYAVTDKRINEINYQLINKTEKTIMPTTLDYVPVGSSLISLLSS